MTDRHCLEDRLRLYQARAYSVHQMSQLFHCSRSVVRHMLAQDWNHPAVRAFLAHLPPVPSITPSATAPRPHPRRRPLPPPQRVAFDDHFHQPGF